jgi:glutamate-1-semialdehyde 2,1-aminomutase
MKNRGQKLYKNAKKIIPGGNSLLSKRPEMFLPELWPAYFDHTNGCEVFDLDGTKYIDVSIMGIGTNTLGYNNKYVDNIIHEVVRKGNMSTLNCPEEVFLAEKLISLHEWAAMARFARTGGEAMTIALRIARAASGKNNVAFCGYHGWHDWYLSSNLESSENLDKQLMTGLMTDGVNSKLSDTSFPFLYNDIESLESLFLKKNIGVVVMEVKRNIDPENNFLSKVRLLCDKYGAVLIFDECTSGFRETFGGLHQKYHVSPDIAMFGKALGNGYAITAVIGNKDVMSFAQNSFISSTFWTERIGFAAGLATLQEMERVKSWDIISSIGKKVKNNWISIFQNHKFSVNISGLDALASFTFKEDHLVNKTLVTKIMLEKGFLATNLFYSCTEHTESICNEYFDKLNDTINLLSKLDYNQKLEMLDTGVCHSGFNRLN